MSDHLVIASVGAAQPVRVLGLEIEDEEVCNFVAPVCAVLQLAH